MGIWEVDKKVEGVVEATGRRTTGRTAHEFADILWMYGKARRRMRECVR